MMGKSTVTTCFLSLLLLVTFSMGCQGRGQSTGQENQYLALDTASERHILLPLAPYRGSSENDRVSNIINQKWKWLELDRVYTIFDGVLGNFCKLSYVTGGYHVATLLNTNSEETAEVIVPNSGAVDLFLNLPGVSENIDFLKEYRIDDRLLYPRGVLYPGDTVKLLGAEDVQYTVVASGTSPWGISRGEKGSFRLDFYEDGKLVVPLIDQSEYNGTETAMYLILDLNNDEKPDFILSSPRHDRENRVIIWLSGETYTRYEEVVQGIYEDDNI